MTEGMREKVRRLKAKVSAEIPSLRLKREEALKPYREADTRLAHAEYQVSHLDNMLWGLYEPTTEEWIKIEEELKE